MNEVVKFTVPGSPVGKGRPRFSTQGQYVRTYTPEKTASYENLVKLEYQRQCGQCGMLEGAIRATITAVFPIPKSASKKLRLRMAQGSRHTKKCDADNIAKAILDALNNIAYADDSAISDLQVYKRYGEHPGVEVILEEVEDNE
ncbi:RusA family crossover junction endodeoxyribonuclease [Eubacteriales bacterium OttesenSCG-928-N13]|nr:RusA family crossover junction endodeoxyribonuclease [Eubacteriales bacterium OttesenSCG-928-N13]